MEKYVITLPCIDKKKEEDVVELQKLHPSLVSHVRLVTDNREFEVATPSPEINELKAALVAAEADLKGNDDELFGETYLVITSEAAFKAATTKGK